MRRNRRFEWFIGFFFGLLAPVFGLALFVEMYPALQSIDNLLDPAWVRILVRLATFGLIFNALLFFAALKFDKESIAKGLLWASACYLIPLLVLQFV